MDGHNELNGMFVQPSSLDESPKITLCVKIVGYLKLSLRCGETARTLELLVEWLDFIPLHPDPKVFLICLDATCLWRVTHCFWGQGTVWSLRPPDYIAWTDKINLSAYRAKEPNLNHAAAVRRRRPWRVSQRKASWLPSPTSFCSFDGGWSWPLVPVRLKLMRAPRTFTPQSFYS